MGKSDLIDWIKNSFKEGDTCLDVGACDGKYANLLKDYLVIDGVEVFKPYIERYQLDKKYNHIYNVDIVDFKYDWYDLIIFGDIIEHLDIKDAQKVIDYARSRCKDMIIAVPYKYKQGIVDNNPHQAHIQDDLTRELFDERYPGFELLFLFNNSDGTDQYGYYHKSGDKV